MCEIGLQCTTSRQQLGPTAGPTELCEDCPVRRECLEAALADPELIGLWGGSTEAERREIRQRRMAQGAACNNVQ